MIGKRDESQMITAKEAVTISLKAGTVTSMNRALDIIDTLRATAPKFRAWTACGDKWSFYVALAAIYDAGRIQGIREERAKNREHKRQAG